MAELDPRWTEANRVARLIGAQSRYWDPANQDWRVPEAELLWAVLLRACLDAVEPPEGWPARGGTSRPKPGNEAKRAVTRARDRALRREECLEAREFLCERDQVGAFLAALEINPAWAVGVLRGWIAARG